LKFNLLSLLVLTGLIALIMAVYVRFASPVIRLGMPRGAVLYNLRSAGALDLVEQDGRSWYAKGVGRFEIKFDDNYLKSITCWDGKKDESVEELVLQEIPK